MPKPDVAKAAGPSPTKSNVSAGNNSNSNNDSHWYNFFNGHNPGGYFLYELNKFNPLANVVNAVNAYISGHDTYGVKQSNGQATVQLASAIPVGRLSSTIVNVAADIGLLEVTQGIASTLANANSMTHVLASKHNLNLLLSKAGSEVNIIKRLYLSLGQSGTLPASGVFEKVVNIYGYNVTIRGAVVNGVPRISTAFIP